MEKGKNNTNDKSKKESKFVKAYHDRIQAIYEKSSKSDDLDRVWEGAITKVKGQVIFETLHPDSKKGRETKKEGKDKRFIRKNFEEIDGLIGDNYDDPELIIRAYGTIRQKRTIKTSDVGKTMLTDPNVIEGRKAVARDEKNQRTDNSEKKLTDE